VGVGGPVVDCWEVEVVLPVELDVVLVLVLVLDAEDDVDDLGEAADRNCCSVTLRGVLESEHACLMVE